jgi:hypothetical protein
VHYRLLKTAELGFLQITQALLARARARVTRIGALL